MRSVDQEYLQQQERVHLGAYVDRELAVAIARLARSQDRSVSAELRIAAREHVLREQENEAERSTSP